MNRNCGLLIDWIGNHYTETIIDEAMDFCSERGLSLVVTTVGHLSYTLSKDAFDEFLFPVTASHHIERYLIASSQISSHGGRAVLENHLRKLTGKPMVCLGGALAGIPLVKAPIQTAFEGLLDHLFDEHGYRRFAWVGGPSDNLESEERKGLFLQFLARHRLPAARELMLDGNFTYGAGKQAALTLAQRRREWDVVVAANDTMAVALREILGADAPITGFDNSPAARQWGFTTIDPHLSAMTEKALSLLLETSGPAGDVPTVLDLPATFVLRESCGCPKRADEAPVLPLFDQSTERIGMMAQAILGCADMEELEHYLNHRLPDEGFRFWKLLPVEEPNREIPADLAESGTSIIVLALALDTDLYGFLLLDLQSRDYAFAEWLRVHITLLLKSWHKRSAGIQVQKMLGLEIEKLERRRSDIEAVVNSLPVWIAEVDRQFRIRYLNQAASSLLRVSAGEVRNRSFLDFVSERDRNALKALLVGCRDSKKKAGCCFFFEDKEGTVVPVAAEIDALPEVRSVNLSTLFGSLSFEGGVRLVGLPTRILAAAPKLDGSFFRDFAFSGRQTEILGWLAEGLTVPTIAQKMGVTEPTIRVQIHLIYARTGVHDRQSLTRLMDDYRLKTLFS